MRRNVYSGVLRLYGEEHEVTLLEAYNYADELVALDHYEEAKALLRKMMPVARRVFGEGNEITFKMRMVYATALYLDAAATLDDCREAATTLEETERTARRVLGSAHPTTMGIEEDLQIVRAALTARDD